MGVLHQVEKLFYGMKLYWGDKKVSIYKITFKPTGEYYFGQSINVNKRLAEHICAIVGICQCEDSVSAAQPFQKALGAKAREHLNGKRTPSVTKQVMDMLQISILAEVDPEVAGLVERYYINHNQGPLSLNVTR